MNFNFDEFHRMMDEYEASDEGINVTDFINKFKPLIIDALTDVAELLDIDSPNGRIVLGILGGFRQIMETMSQVEPSDDGVDMELYMQLISAYVSMNKVLQATILRVSRLNDN